MLTVPARDAAVPSFRIDASGTVVLTITGDVDAEGVRAVHRGVIDALRRHRPSLIRLDLRGCGRIDAAGLRGLRLCRSDAAQVDCRLDLVRAPVPVLSLLQGAGILEKAGIIENRH
jgi:ABC-type transporter Mla MlaB component